MKTGMEKGPIWAGTTSATRPMIGFLVVVLAGGSVLIAQDSLWGAAVFAIVLALLLVTFMYARVAVDDRGVEVRMGPFGWPRVFRPASEISSVKVRRVEWWRYGLGYRLIWHGTAVVPRGGNAVELGLKSGRRFVFSTDDPEGATRRINDVIAGS
jgi:hypothetical protein